MCQLFISSNFMYPICTPKCISSTLIFLLSLFALLLAAVILYLYICQIVTLSPHQDLLLPSLPIVQCLAITHREPMKWGRTGEEN